MKNGYRHIYILFFICFFACESKNTGALLRLNAARSLFDQKQYIKAKQEIDSIKSLYPKAFDEIRASLALLDSIRRAENEYIIHISDSMIASSQLQVEDLIKEFVYDINPKYQTEGAYVPKQAIKKNGIASTTIRSWVMKDGRLYIESVYVGNAEKHNKIRVSDANGTFAETLVVKDDGLSYRFSNLGKEYEIIHFEGKSENGISKYISLSNDRLLTVTLKGQTNYKYLLSKLEQSAIAKSYRLSVKMQCLDSLRTEKEKAEYHIYYLDNKKNK